MPKFDIGSAITALNQRLKDACVPVTVELNGSKLVMRSTLPKKLKDGGLGNKQYRISLGFSSNREGIKLIERKAHELREQVEKGTFDWSNWERSRAPKPNEIPISELVEQFKSFYLDNNSIKESTWINEWQRTFNRLPQDESLTDTLILAAVLSTDINTETRNRTCQRLQMLADYVGIEIDLAPHRGNYGHASVQPRDLPNDDEIVAWRDRIPNLAWQWVYGMIATFGLRPHECFACEFIDRYTVRVFETVKTRTGTDKTKTGYHVARAFPPEWSDQWNLIDIVRPPVTAQRTSDYGNRNKRQFQRYEIPFPAYNLRHAYALRGSLYNMNTAQMAKIMGHSESVHIRTYRRWLSEAEVQREYDAKVLKKRD